jgi:hypothetical protein
MKERREIDLAKLPQELGPVDQAELAQVGGGYDEGNWCGTRTHPLPYPPPHFPPPHVMA